MFEVLKLHPTSHIKDRTSYQYLMMSDVRCLMFEVLKLHPTSHIKDRTSNPRTLNPVPRA